MVFNVPQILLSWKALVIAIVLHCVNIVFITNAACSAVRRSDWLVTETITTVTLSNLFSYLCTTIATTNHDLYNY